MDKKTLPIVILLILAVLLYWPALQWLGLYEPAQPSEPSAVTDSIMVDSTVVATTSQESPETTAAQPQSLTTLQQLAAQTQASPDSLSIDSLVISTNKFETILSSMGGGPVSLLLQEYRYRDGLPVQMLPNAKQATPDAVFADGSFFSSAISYQSSLPPGEYDATRDTVDVEYTYTSESGGELIKKYRFYPDRYDYELVVELRRPDLLGFERSYQLWWNTPLSTTEPRQQMDYDAMEAVAMMSGSRENLNDFEDNRLNESLDGYTEYAGVRSKYFAGVMIPVNRTADGVHARGNEYKISATEGRIDAKDITVGLEMPFANMVALADTFKVFVGPLDYTLMSEYDVDLEAMLNIGTTPVVGWLIKPFAIGVIWLLPRMYDVIPNYGVVIILFALLVKIVTMPLSMKSFKSMNAMKELQPKIDEMKRKHKKNPQQLNAEMMKMYKAHGVNPMSGCLPMLPQMPLFFAMFSVFRSTILLRGAPFVGFIDDLSVGATGFTDPYIILVVLMIGAQFLSQKFTMTSTQQNKALGYLMPLFMGFIFYKFAAGLVLYWACFSLFSLLDYLVFKRQPKNPQVKSA
ncbi:MAG: membrane protein insertase YidC [Candidatus Zixiibacteriota bacterium]